MSASSTLRLTVVTPERQVLDQMVREVVLPGKAGYLGVLPGHYPLITLLQGGELRFGIGEGRFGYVAVAGGFAEVQGDSVRVLAQRAELPDEIQLDAAMQDRDEAFSLLRHAEADVDVAMARLEDALGRMKVAKRAKGESA